MRTRKHGFREERHGFSNLMISHQSRALVLHSAWSAIRHSPQTSFAHALGTLPEADKQELNERMTVEIQVRFPVDDAELSALHRRAFSRDDTNDTDATQPWASRLERHSLTWVGAFSVGVLVGFVHAVWDGGAHAFILDTAVRPDFQRTGIGRTLVETVTNEAFAAGCEWVHVDYDLNLVGFYEKACGFRPTPAGLRSNRGD